MIVRRERTYRHNTLIFSRRMIQTSTISIAHIDNDTGKYYGCLKTHIRKLGHIFNVSCHPKCSDK